MVAAVLAFGVGSAAAQAAFHGMGVAKGCDSPTKIGDPYSCSYAIFNTVDTANDTLKITGLTDIVHSAGGNVGSGNILGALQLVFSGPVTCVGGSGSGTSADPYIGATACTLPFGSSLFTNSHSFYTVQAADFTLPNHELTDTATVAWNDLCDGVSNNCTTGQQQNSAGSSSLVEKLASQTATSIHNAQHQVVTSVAAGSTVHDFVTVTGQPEAPIPSGTVSIDWFTNNTCAGSPATTSGAETLDASGHVDATDFPQGPLAAGLYGFRAHYGGDATYLPSDGACEPLAVVDANISITPNGVNRLGQTHTFTAHVNVNDGTGFANAPDGTQISFTIDSGPGSFTSPNPCTISGGTGSCTVNLSSAITGVTTVSAHTTVAVLGVVLTRSTDGTGTNSGPATKRWVDARIHIAPSATNRVGAPHTFTVTLEKDTGDGAGFVPAAGEHVDVTLTDANGASHTAPTGTCTNAGANTDASGQCTITFTSSSTGTVTGHATSTLSVAGSAAFTVQTDGVAPNGPDAVKTFVDAKISIAPDATNRIGQQHTFTVTLLKDLGDGNGFVAAAGESVTVTLTGHDGATPSPPGPLTGTTDGAGHFQVTFTSATTGTVTAHASSTLTIGPPPPATIHVETDGTGGNSGDATKTFVDARIHIAPDATNRVGQPHTFTVTLEKDTGNGAGFQPAAGEHVDVTLTDSNGAAHTAPTGTCTTAGANTDASGQCTITFTSPTGGKVTGHATSTLSVGGVSITVATDGVAPNGPDAVKTFVDATIAITPNATNEVGQPHTFTVTLLKDTGNGGGFQPAAGEHVDVTLTDSDGASHTAPTGTCTSAGVNTDANGQCTITFSSPTAGKVTGHATSTLNVGGVSITVATDGQSGNSGDAVKTFVDAYITISPPTAVNPINTIHTYTAHVFINDGTGAGYADAPNGTVVSFAFVGQHVGSFVAANQCTVGNGAGTCTVDTTSTKPGNDVMSASTTVSVGGVVLTRTTGQPAPGHANSDNAQKDWVGAKITIAPDATNEVGKPHTFTVTVSVDNGNGYQPAAGQHIDVTLTDAGGAAHTSPTGSCLTAGPNTDANGQCTITFTSPAAGTVTGHATATIPVDGHSITVATDGTGDNSVDAVKTFVDADITITPNATNEVHANHTFTVTVKKNAGDGNGFVPAAGVTVTTSISNANGATAVYVGPSSCTTLATGSCTVVISSPTAGTTTANASATLTVGGVSLTRDTDPATASVGAGPGGSGPAVKTWVDANIQITPATANNPVSATHTLTGHVNVNTGSGAFANAPAGTTITFAIISGPGSFVGSVSSCQTVATTGSCTVQITSATTGTTVVRASTSVNVGGVTLQRSSGDSKVGDSVDASKNWGDVTVHTDILSAATGGIVTSVVAGTIVHDSVQVQRVAGTPASVPNPTGTVIFHRYTTADCSGTSTDQSVALTPGNPSTAISADFAPVAGSLSYKADYSGDANYPARTGACEPLTVTPVPAPAIAIVKNPKNQTVAVGGTAKFQITVTNVGNTVLTNVTVSDPLSPNCNRTSAQIPALASMAPGASASYSCSKPNVQKAMTNVATATGTPPTGTNVTATDTAPVKVKALPPPKKHVKVVSHKRPKATG